MLRHRTRIHIAHHRQRNGRALSAAISTGHNLRRDVRRSSTAGRSQSLRRSAAGVRINKASGLRQRAAHIVDAHRRNQFDNASRRTTQQLNSCGMITPATRTCGISNLPSAKRSRPGRCSPQLVESVERWRRPRERSSWTSLGDGDQIRSPMTAFAAYSGVPLCKPGAFRRGGPPRICWIAATISGSSRSKPVRYRRPVRPS